MAHGSVETSFGKRARIRTGLRCVVVDVCIKNLSSWNTEAASGSSNRVGKKKRPRLRDSACWRSGEITQPRKKFFGLLCMCKIRFFTNKFKIKSFDLKSVFPPKSYKTYT